MINWDNFVVISAPKKRLYQPTRQVTVGQSVGELFLAESCTRTLCATTAAHVAEALTYRRSGVSN